MSVRVDWTDEVPTEIGVYIVNDPIQSWPYKPVEVYERERGGPLYAKCGAYELEEDEFERCRWSERLDIAPPDSK